jgi:lipopolysaccharide cholinephosphotransferase
LERLLKSCNRFTSKCYDSVYYAHESVFRRILSYGHPVFRLSIALYLRLAGKISKANKSLGADCQLGAGFDTPWIRYFRFDDIYPLTELEVVGARFYAPHHPDIYLKIMYGADYMTPPPEDKRPSFQHAQTMKPILDA